MMVQKTLVSAIVGVGVFSLCVAASLLVLRATRPEWQSTTAKIVATTSGMFLTLRTVKCGAKLSQREIMFHYLLVK